MGKQTIHMPPLLTKIYPLYRRVALALLIAGLLVLGGWVTRQFLTATETYGVGVRTDSVAYLWGAQSLAHGLGLVTLDGLGGLKPITHWPPFYPLTLTVFEILGVPALDGARWLGAALVSLIVLLSGLTVWRMTRSLWFSLGAAVLLALAPSLWNTSLDAMTEPLYVALGLGGALLLDGFLTRGGRWRFGLSALCLALALLTRYAGVSLVAAAALVLLLTRRPRWGDGLKQAILYGLLCVAPLLLWLLHNELVAGSATNRYLNLVPIAASDWLLLRQTMEEWIAPLQVTFAIGTGKLVLIALAAAGFGVLHWLERAAAHAPGASAGPGSTPAAPRTYLPLFYGLYAVIYPLFVIFSRLAFDTLITIFEERIAFPFFLTLLLLIAWGAWWLLRQAARRGWLLGAGLVGLYTLLLWSFMVQYQDGRTLLVNSANNGGRGLNSPQMLESAISMQARALDNDRVYFTDNIEMLYFVSGHPSFQINNMDAEEQQFLHTLDADHRLTFVFFYSPTYAKQVRQVLPDVQQIFKNGDRIILSTAQ